MYILLIIIGLSYITLIISLIYGFNKLPNFESTNTIAQYYFSIIIPFRNEVDHIKDLANSLMQLDYPTTHFEILFVNDSSTDNSVPLLTEFIIKNFNWKLIDNIRKSNSPKKDAIDIAIQHAKYDWIITTDADCIVPKEWLNSYNGFIDSCLLRNDNKEDNLKKESHFLSKNLEMINDKNIYNSTTDSHSYEGRNLVMIAAPVSYQINSTFLHQFQLLDFLSLIGTTIGSFGLNKPFMCNGANLCYSKQLFLDLNGFDGNNNIASGDDVFLLEKAVTRYPKQVKYLKSIQSLVLTKPENSLKDLINQRIRWASKTSATKNVFGKFVGIIVFLENLIILWALFFGLWFTNHIVLIVIILLLKLVVDYLLINKTHQFTHQKLELKTYLLSGILYPFFVVFVVVKSFFTKVQWKDNVFDK